MKEAYLDFLKTFKPPLDGLKLTVDCSNGMANLLIKELLDDSVSYLFDTLDGTFPNHEPNPLEEENVAALKKAVLEQRSDLGIIFDGDADRVMFVDEKGRFIQPDIITAVMGRYFLAKEKGNVLQDIRTSRSTTEYLEKLGATVTTWKVGHAFAKVKMRELQAIFGGELAGHYYFRDFNNCDSGFLACLVVLQVLKTLHEEGRTFSSLIDEIIVYKTSGEINFKLEKKDEAMEALYTAYAINSKPEKIYDIDGYRIEFKDWWFNVRKSNTEPYLRLVVEAHNESLLSEKLAELKAIIADHS